MKTLDAFALGAAGAPPVGCRDLFGYLLGLATTNPLVITTQPEDYEGPLNSTATFTITVTGGAGDPSYQWKYRSTPTGKWSNVSADSGKTAEYSLTVKERHDGYQYKCVVTDGKGRVASRVVTLTIED